MAIEKVYGNDNFGKHDGYYIRETIIKSRALAILEPGAKPTDIAHLDEYHYAVYHKKAYAKSECEAVYDSLEEAEEALKEFMKEE